MVRSDSAPREGTADQELQDVSVSTRVSRDRRNLNIDSILDEAPSAAVTASGWDHVYDNMGRYYRFGVTIQL
jgi:hypothetical protein